MHNPGNNSGMNVEFDVIIVGSGLVGAACALALSRQNLKIALIESQAASGPPDSTLDSRVYAISPGNMTWLESLGLRDLMDMSRICAIEDMQVQGDDGAQLALRSYEADVGSLGFIVENKVLQHALQQSLQRSNISLITGQACSVAWLEGKAELRLQDGQVFAAQLLIAADGVNSWLRSQAGIAVTTRDYGQMGVVANFETELAHAQVARQWFRPDGVLAWLPLPGKRISMVWSTSTDYARHLLTL
ncbi:MAG TPA: FAD-dependent oxidoreductase, partial [Methylophilaceae bacterium]|nr:FAD-dependent oxidoreductase [Methylophilaceae bacterium]